MTVSRLRATELVAVAGGVLLLAGLVVPWYSTRGNGQIDGANGTLSGWSVHPVLRWLLLAAACAPFVLAWIVARDHELSWGRGELTAVVAVAAFGLTVYNGIIDRPGEPPGEISLKAGWFASTAGIALMFYGGAKRASESERPRKPPGVL